MTKLMIGAAQIGGIQKAETREEVVARMMKLMDEAHEKGVEFLAYPEMTLTTFFPREYVEDRAQMDSWFETEMPNAATQPLFDLAQKYKMGFTFGYCELTPEGEHYNTSIIVSPEGEIVLKYRKTHLPGHAEYEPERTHQHLEKRYFLPGNTGFQVAENQGVLMGMAICNDRRWPETYRVMGLQGVDMVMLGYNTPFGHTGKHETDALTNFHNHLSMQAGAYQNATWVVGTAKCGDEEGSVMGGQSVIVAPSGEIVAQAYTMEDEVITAKCDLDAGNIYRETVFNFAIHRRPEHYGMIVDRTGAIPPAE